MRSITFISAVMLAGHAVAQGMPTHGCFARDYGADHLAKNPDQIVARMVAEIDTAEQILPDLTDWEEMSTSSRQETWMRLAVWTANQGHVGATGHGNRRFDQILICGGGGCGVECDGGGFDIERDDGDTLQFRTDYLMVGEIGGCGGAIDLAERPSEAVSYRLTRVPDALCEREFGN